MRNVCSIEVNSDDLGIYVFVYHNIVAEQRVYTCLSIPCKGGRNWVIECRPA